jgi:hypothetical protein
MESSTESPVPETGAPQPMSFAQRLTAIFFEPKKLFDDVARRRSWLGVFIIASVLTAAAVYTVTSRMDREAYLRKAIQMNPLTRNIPDAQISALVSRPPGIYERISPILSPINLLIGYALLAGIFFLLFLLIGTGISYKSAFAVTVWAVFPSSAVLLLLSILLSYVKDPATLEINPASNVASHLGWLVSDEKAHPGLSSLLSSLDLFSFWSIALLSVGFVSASEGKLTTAKAATAIGILWLIWVLGKAGVLALMG